MLEGTIPLEQALISAPNVTQLTAVPSHSGNTNAGQLVCSEAMRQVVRDLRQRFQFVIIDTAPLLPFADGQALSTIVDGLVFVGRSGITTRDAVRRSLELLQQVHGAPILQFVLNGADVNSSDYQYYRQGARLLRRAFCEIAFTIRASTPYAVFLAWKSRATNLLLEESQVKRRLKVRHVTETKCYGNSTNRAASAWSSPRSRPAQSLNSMVETQVSK